MTPDQIDTACQTILVFTGCGSLYMMASQEAKHRMYGAMLGLAGEPFWFTTAYLNGQWGVAALACVYGLSWLRVFFNNWRACNDNR